MKTLKYKSTDEVYIKEAGTFVYLYSNNGEALNKYMFVVTIKDEEKRYGDLCNDRVEAEYEKAIWDWEYTDELQKGVVVLKSITEPLESLDVDGNEIDDEAIYYQIDPEEEPWLFKKTDDKNDESDKLVKKYHLDDYYWEDEDDDEDVF